jgi:uncharacterized protein
MTGEQIGQTGLHLVILAVMLFGLFSLFIPVLPGLVIIWVPALVYGLITGFNWVSGVLFALMTVLMIVGNVVDNFIMGARARQTGASWLAIGAALVAGLLGSLIMPPFGGLIAALLALFGVEMLRLNDLKRAYESTRSMAAGCGWAVLVRFAIGLMMIFLWGLWVFFA